MKKTIKTMKLELNEEGFDYLMCNKETSKEEKDELMKDEDFAKKDGVKTI